VYRCVYLNREIDKRIDRVKCEDEEEHCNICRESNIIINEFEAQRRVYIQREQEKQDRLIDSAIDISTSNIPFPEIPSDGVNSSNSSFPSSSSGYSRSNTVSFNQGFMANRISQREYIIFQSQ